MANTTPTAALANRISEILGHAFSVDDEQMNQVRDLADWWAVSRHNFIRIGAEAWKDGHMGPSAMWDIESRLGRTVVFHETGTGRMKIKIVEDSIYGQDRLDLEIWAGGETPEQVLEMSCTLFEEGVFDSDVSAFRQEMVEGEFVRRLYLLAELAQKVPGLQQAMKEWTLHPQDEGDFNVLFYEAMEPLFSSAAR